MECEIFEVSSILYRGFYPERGTGYCIGTSSFGIMYQASSYGYVSGSEKIFPGYINGFICNT